MFTWKWNEKVNSTERSRWNVRKCGKNVLPERVGSGALWISKQSMITDECEQFDWLELFANLSRHHPAK